MARRLYLASTSPRRAELLAQIGVAFQSCAPAVDETPQPGEMPTAYVERLARAKALAVQAPEAHACVLGADTAVVLDGRILGKPVDKQDGIAMLRALSGRRHQVLTAVAVAQDGACLSEVVSTEVCFRALSEAEIQAYWASGEPCDKAGAYGIQGLAAVFVTRIEGSYSAVVGLPLCETARLLARCGIACWNLENT